MKIRHSTGSGQDKIELQMTPMIDIVFQLLVFFIMTFKIVAQEGDFHIKLPPEPPIQAQSDPLQLPPMILHLTADESGTLSGIRLNDASFNDFRRLSDQMIAMIADPEGPTAESVEIELDCAFQLRYEYVIAAMSAISGYVDGDGHLVKLVEKIRFRPAEPDAGQ